MTGPEHYGAAEALLEAALDRKQTYRPDLLAAAQAHATLALAWATEAAQLHQASPTSHLMADYGGRQ